MKNFNKCFTIIPDGPYKGSRLYCEDKCGAEYILPVELYYLFKHSININYEIYYLVCNANHNIDINSNDLEYIKKNKKQPAFEKYIKHNFSNNTLNIKNNQHNDILQIYDLSINSNQIGAFFIYPHFDFENKYCFNFFLIVKPNFDINILFELNFKLIKIRSVIKYTLHNLSVDLLQKMYNLNNVEFKDFIIDEEEQNKAIPSNTVKLQEEIDFESFRSDLIKLKQNNPEKIFFDLDKKEILLREKWLFEADQLIDTVLLKKLFFEKMCWQFYFFEKCIGKNTIFYTNFYDIIGANIISNLNGTYKIEYDCLFPCSLDDLFENDPHSLYSLYYNIWRWYKK